MVRNNKTRKHVGEKMISSKKINAMLALFSIAALIIHAGYQTVSYAILYYNPVVSKVLGYIIVIPVVCHIFLSVISVLFLHDSRTIAYWRFNLAIIIQRICAVLLLCLFPVHIQSFELLQAHPDGPVFALIKVAEILFYAVLFTHISVSFSRALVALGIMKNIENKKRLDHIVWIVCAVLFIVVNWFVVVV